MMRKNRGIYDFLGPYWVLITMVWPSVVTVTLCSLTTHKNSKSRQCFRVVLLGAMYWLMHETEHLRSGSCSGAQFIGLLAKAKSRTSINTQHFTA